MYSYSKPAKNEWNVSVNIPELNERKDEGRHATGRNLDERFVLHFVCLLDSILFASILIPILSG